MIIKEIKRGEKIANQIEKKIRKLFIKAINYK